MKDKKLVAKVNANGVDVSIISTGDSNDYLSLTDIAKYKSDEPNDVIKNWIRNKDTIEFLGLWEKINNENFKPVEFDRFKTEAGKNAFTLSPTKWINATNAIGIRTAAGRYGGTFAHIDIAFEFASWVSAEFKLYLIKDYQRLKNDENSKLSLDWNLNRTLSKLNYRIHTDAIKENLIPKNLTSKEIAITYANEADVLNVALFSKTAKMFKSENKDKKGNLRDYATTEQLLVLVNLENLNAQMIMQGVSQKDRLLSLNKTAIKQLTQLTKDSNRKLEKFDIETKI